MEADEKNVMRFNPCFSGCRPATKLYDKEHGRGTKVSILVLVDAALRRFDLFDMVKEDEVSILVLVDAALRHLERLRCQLLILSFNPCFSGCRPATSRQVGQ